MILTIPLKKIEIPGGGMHLAVSVSGNNFQSRAIIDTGASQSIFHKESIEDFISEIFEIDDDQMSSGVNAMLSGHQMAELNNLNIGPLSLNDIKVGIMDLTHIRNLYQNQMTLDICGLIGGDVLNKYKAEINYYKSVLILHKH